MISFQRSSTAASRASDSAAGVDGLNPAGAIAGSYQDASNVFHGFVRAPNGAITTFDAPGAGTGLGQARFAPAERKLSVIVRLAHQVARDLRATIPAKARSLWIEELIVAGLKKHQKSL